MGVSSLHASVIRLANFSQPVRMYTKSNSLGIMEVPKPVRNMLQQRVPLKCPRCNSTNTKFCYYNNNSKAQPRYLCKACRRHWTEGGTLRDVPVGGGRKNKRAKAATTNEIMLSATSTSNISEIISNNNNPAVLRLLNENPSSLVPEILHHMLLQPAQQVFPLPLQPPPQTISPDFGMMTNLVGQKEIIGNYLGSYTNGLNDTFSISGYAHTDTGGAISMVPPMQLNTGNWSTWVDDISGLANPDVKPSTTEGC